MENIFYHIWMTTGIFLLIGIAVFAVCFHMIFKPDYRPGLNSMPFLWFQMVTSVYKQSQKAIVLSKLYNLYALAGLCKIHEKEKIVSISICGKKYVILFTPDAAEVVLSSTKLIHRSADYNGLKLMLREGLFTSNGDKWRNRRKMLTPAFHFKILQDFLPLMQEASVAFFSNAEALTSQSWVDLNTITLPCVFLMMMKSAVGMDVELDEEAIASFNAADKFTVGFATRIARPWLYPDFLFNLSPVSKQCNEAVNIIHNFIRKVIIKKKEILLKEQHICKANEIEQNGHSSMEDNGHHMNARPNPVKKVKNKPFLDMLLELHLRDSSFTEEDVLDESLIFFTAASDALGNSLGYILYCIGLYKNVQKEIQEELDEIFGNSDRNVTEEDIRSMKYLECVIKEALRIYGIHFISREATESFQVYDYIVPQGSTVVIFNYMIHRDPSIYPNPEKFDPSRFFPENCIGRHPYAYLPFSAGPRNCIAMKFCYQTMKIACASILRKFNLTSLDNRDDLFDIRNLASKELKDPIPLRVKITLRERI